MTSSPDLDDLDSEITKPDNMTVQEFAVKEQQVADCASSSSEGELDAVGQSGSEVKMERAGEGGTEEEEETEEGLLGTEVNLEDEEEERSTEEEEMRDRLCKLVAQARLSYFASTDDELDKLGVTEEDQECGKEAMEEQEAEEDDEEEEVKKRKLSDEEIGNLPFRIRQLERQVRASQFSSTEDELDRVGAEDDETRTEDGDGAELAVKVCRLASQVNATQFSSTEDELDRVGRGEEEEEEAMDEETLWKLQAEKAVQASQLRDLSCLVSPSRFSSSEGLEVDEETECQNDAVVEGSVWERTESLEDLDVGMFDLKVETEDSSKESGDEKVSTRLLQSQKKPVMLEGEKEEVKVREESESQSLDETVCKDTKRVKEIENESVMCETEAHRDKEADREEAEAPQEDLCDGKENLDSTPGGSDDEDEEFNRIISSMLMMTLEDMQGGVFDGDNAEDVGKPDRAAMEEEVKAEWRPDGQNVPRETGSLEQRTCGGQSETLEFAAVERRTEDEGEQDRTRQSDGNRSEKEEEEETHLAGEGSPLTEGEEKPGGGGDCQEDRGPGKEPADREDDICPGEEEGGTSCREGPLSPQEIHIVRPSQLNLTPWSVEQLRLIFRETMLDSSMSPFH